MANNPDSLTRTILAGAQDIGTLLQTGAGMANSWTDATQGDGGQPAVDNQSLASESMSVRYTGNNGYAGFTRSIYTASSTFVQSATTSLGYVVNSGPVSLQLTNPIMVGGTLATTLTQYSPEFYPVYRLNSINQKNIAFGGTQYIFVSHDMDETLTNLNPTTPYSDNVLGLSYGGVHNGVSNPGVIWVASASSVYLTENETTPNLVWTATTGQLKALATLSSDYYTTAVSSDTNVFLTQDKTSFSDITGNLLSDGMTSILTLNFLSGTNSGDPVFLLAGGIGGLYATDISSTDGWDLGDWRSLSPLGSDDGSYLPNAIITSLDYDSASDELIVGTSGRGIWTLNDASTLIAAVPEPSATGLLLMAGLGLVFLVKKRNGRLAS